MHRAGAAEGKQRALASIDTTLHRDSRQRPHHGGVGDALHAERQLDDVDTETRGQRREGGFRRGDVERDRATQTLRRVEIAQDRIGVGDGRQRAAPSVGRGTRFRAGALRADRQAAGPQCHQRAAASADRFDGDHRLSHRPSRELGIGGDLGRAAQDQADIGRRAAHVEGQHLLKAERRRDAGRRRNPGGRAGQRHRQRPLRCGLGRGHASRRMHDVQAGALHFALQPIEVACRDGHDGGVEDRGRRALEFARLRIDLV